MLLYNLYPCFKHWPGVVWFYSDPHFSDIESYKIRFPEEFNFEGCDVRPSDEWVAEKLDEMQIKNINRKVNKLDTLVILGDVGNTDCIKKLKAKYKVLILGNHDAGVCNYTRSITKIHESHCSGFEALKAYKHAGEYWVADNGLFDEVYTGLLMINSKIILSHEPVDFEYAFNIHGHDHSCSEYKKHVLENSNFNIDYYIKAVKENNIARLNVIPEMTNYEPISLNELYKTGIFSDVKNIHRATIEKAKERLYDI